MPKTSALPTTPTTPATGEAPASSNDALATALAAFDVRTDAALAALTTDPGDAAPYLIALIQRGDATLCAFERSLPLAGPIQLRLFTLLSRARLDQARLVRELTRLRPPAPRHPPEPTGAPDPLPAPAVNPLPARPPAGEEIALHSPAASAPDNDPRARPPAGEKPALPFDATPIPNSLAPAVPHPPLSAPGSSGHPSDRAFTGSAIGGEVRGERQGESTPSPDIFGGAPDPLLAPGAGGLVTSAPVPFTSLEDLYVRIIDPWSPLGWRAVPHDAIPPGAQLVPRHLWRPIHLGLPHAESTGYLRE
jgi:hypothetical protein